MRAFLARFFRWALEKKEFNYLYFSLLLLCISAFAFFRFLLSDSSLFGVTLFFLLYALGQGALEVGIFALAAYLLKRWTPRWVYYSFISVCFGFVLVHFTDFVMGRLLDASVAYLFKFIFGFGIGHIKTAFEACNVNGAMLWLIIGACALIPIGGILLYRLTHRVSHLKPMKLSLQQIALFVGSVGLVLFLLDLSAYPYLTRSSYAKYQKTLPFGGKFLSPPQECIPLTSPIAPPREEKSILKHFPPLSLPEKPNLYVFVIETLRKDFVVPEIAPHLSSFGAENIQFPASFANANSTQLSWFAIFHSDFPYHWTAMREDWKKGSIPLRMLKKLGYKIRVYSSADLRFFRMDELVFGEDRDLADQIEEFSSDRKIDSCDRDLLAFRAFERDIRTAEGREGNLFLFFLDSTHSEYSFPPDFPLKFEPISKQIDYLTITQKDIEPIKNRYRNSVAFVDSLMGRFFETLKKEELYDRAVIAITGDHGEEFFEEGAMFHGTHLNHYQTSVPIFFKFPGSSRPPLAETATHMDLFPSILHHLTNESDFSAYFDGQSIFSEKRWPYRIAVLQNGPDTPCEFSIEKKGYKLLARFLNPRNIYNQTQLEILSLLSPEPLPEGTSFETIVEAQFPGAFDPLLKKSASH